jgi:hypothetical protein
MAQMCARCHRANPRDATYCYHDGILLAGRGGGEVPADGSAMNLGVKPFARPFVLPSGVACHNFLQLTLGLQEDSAGALLLLRKGALESFCASLGRADLAMAAANAARAANPERGLDELLGRLPASALTPARLHVDPTELDLGALRLGEDRQMRVRLRNQGMRLLYGTASCAETDWLALGDHPTRRSQVFQFFGESTLTVRIVGSRLRAYRRPQEGEILLESNGGAVKLVVRVQIAAQPFPDGVLAGALSPRQLAEKAREAPKEAAPLIESGAVARWYADNGWTYPVFGPTASGQAAVQQLFEALGLVKAPEVQLSVDAVPLLGAPGAALEYTLIVSTQEHRAVVAFASSDQPWLHIRPTIFQGRSAKLSLFVPAVPAVSGATLQARVTVMANGRQRFVVPVTLSVVGTPPPAPAPVARPALPVAAPRPQPAPQSLGTRLFAYTLLSLGALLVLGLLLTLGRNLLGKSAAPAGPQLSLSFQDDSHDEYVGAATLTFGLALQDEPTTSVLKKHKRLMYDERGRSNNTCYSVDGHDFLLGYDGGHWQTAPIAGKGPPGGSAVWVHQAPSLLITQHVEIATNVETGRRDTCLIHYTLENRDKAAHRVGLRFLLDTFIGAHDGVPFAIPGQEQMCETTCDLKDSVPDFLQALENNDLRNPGVIAQVTLHPNSKLEKPARVTVAAWPDADLAGHAPSALSNLTRWDVPLRPIKETTDSAVTLYWPEQELPPGSRREVGFAYGLGSLVVDSSEGRLALAVGGDFTPGGEMSVLAYVKDPALDEVLTLKVPAGLTLLSGKETARVPRSPASAMGLYSLVSWRVRLASIAPALHRLRLRSSAGPTLTRDVSIPEPRSQE